MNSICRSTLCAFLIAFSWNAYLIQDVQAQAEPVVQYVAPEKCLFYSGWNPTIQSNPDSENRTEKWLADPEVKSFLDDMAQRIPMMLLSNAAPDLEKIRTLAPLLKSFGKSICRKSGCLFIEDLEIDPKNARFNFTGTLMVEQGPEGPDNVRTIAKLLEAQPSAKARGFFESKRESSQLVVGMLGKYLVVSIGKDPVSELTARGRAKSVPSWLQKTLARGQGLKYQNNFVYLDVTSVKRVVSRTAGPGAGLVTGIIGLNEVQSIEWLHGLNQTETVSTMLIRSNAPPEGVLGLLNTATLSRDQLSTANEDAIYSLTAAVDPASVYQFMLSIEPIIAGRPGALKSELNGFKAQFGFDLMEGLWNQLGPTWTLYNNQRDGLVGGLVLTTEVKDADKLNESLRKFIEMFLLSSGSNDAQILEKTVGKFKIYSLKVPREFACYPSVCIADKRAYLSLFPQAIETAITRPTETPLVNDTLWKTLNPKNEKLTAALVVNERQLIATGYPFLQMMQAINHEFTGWSNKNLQSIVHAIDAPPTEVMMRHADQMKAALKVTDSGLELELRQTFPDPEPAMLTAAVALTAATAINDMPMSGARLVDSRNNLRQIALATLNYEATFRRFPSDLPTLDAEAADNTPKLSWRVHILPFIEQNNLYEQFRQDEPWDSPHNKKLLGKMPDVFRSPASRANKGMTRYRGVGGENGIFAQKRRGKVSFGSITDGSSNTILVLECPDEMAVPWTKPDTGLDYDKVKLSQLLTTYGSGVNAAFCDGSTRMIPKDCSQKDLSSLMQMNEGNIVSIFEQPTRRRGRYDAVDVIPELQIPGPSRILTPENFLSGEAKKEYMEIQKAEQLRLVGLALHNFHDAFRGFPTAYSTAQEGTPLLSWRVHILPYMNEIELYQQFRLDEPWDSPHNKKLIRKIPDIYKAFGDAEGRIGLMANGDPNQGVIVKPLKNGQNRGISLRLIMDGTSNTAMVFTVDPSRWTEWTKPEAFQVDRNVIDWLVENSFILCTADGASRRIDAGQMSREDIKNVMDRQDGNRVRIPWNNRNRARTYSDAATIERSEKRPQAFPPRAARPADREDR